MKRNWQRGILGGLSFSTALFIFQCCYGMPQDLYPEIRYSGQVKSKTTGEPLGGIRVSLKDLLLSDLTNEAGEFLFFSDPMDRVTLLFEDMDSSKNGAYESQDTLLINPGSEVYLQIHLEEQ